MLRLRACLCHFVANYNDMTMTIVTLKKRKKQIWLISLSITSNCLLIFYTFPTLNHAFYLHSTYILEVPFSRWNHRPNAPQTQPTPPPHVFIRPHCLLPTAERPKHFCSQYNQFNTINNATNTAAKSLPNQLQTEPPSSARRQINKICSHFFY